jgi:hypothetical protein
MFDRAARGTMLSSALFRQNAFHVVMRTRITWTEYSSHDALCRGSARFDGGLSPRADIPAAP